jgi:hypothetical protein
MNKRHWWTFLGVFVVAASAWAMIGKYNSALVNDGGLAYTKSFPMSMYGPQGNGVDFLSFTAVCSSTTMRAKTFSGSVVTIGSPIIPIAKHGFSLAAGVVYTSTHTDSPLTNGTTYYVIPWSTNSIQLALTSTGAIAGSYITLLSSTTGTTNTLTPSSLSGNTSYKWQVSNDGMNWGDYTASDQGVAISSVSLTAAQVATGSTKVWDFGEIDYAWIRLAFTKPTAGAVRLLVYGNGKNSSH